MKFGGWEPDAVALGSQGMAICRNVYASAKGYIPARAMVQLAAALDEQYMGGGAFLADDGSPRVLAGSTTDLYSLVAGAWTSILDTLTITKPWHFVQFGDYAVGVYGGDPVEIILSANTAGTLSGSPPTADLCAVVRDFVVLGRCDSDETMVTWSAFNDHTGWTAGTDQSGFQPMLTGGKITGLAGGEYGLILQRERITRMTYTGDPDNPFQFDEISTNYGCIVEGSVAQAGNICFCYSHRGFIKIEAGGITPIGVERVDKTFRDSYSHTDFENITCVVDPERTIVMWHIYGRTWCYNWILDRWTDVSLSSQAIFTAFTSGITLDQLDALYTDLDHVPGSLDNPLFSGGNPRVIYVASDGTFNGLDGNNLTATFRASPQEPYPGRRARISRARPVTDAIGGMTLTLDHRQRLGDPEASDVYTVLRPSGEMPARTSGRFITPTLEIAASTVWTYASGIEFPGMVSAGSR